jgi:hypothetical protein
MDGEEPGHLLGRATQDEIYVSHPRPGVDVNNLRLPLWAEDQQGRHVYQPTKYVNMSAVVREKRGPGAGAGPELQSG